MVSEFKIFKFAHWMVLLGLFSMVLMDQLRRLGPPLPWLKLSQSSTFLTGMDSLVSKGPEKVKKLLITQLNSFVRILKWNEYVGGIFPHIS